MRTSEQFCHKGKCVECIADMNVKKIGMKCSHGKWVPDSQNRRMPCRGGRGGCPDGFGMARVYLTDGTERCECWFKGYEVDRSDSETTC